MERRLIDANAIHGDCNSDNPEFLAGWNALAVEIDQAPTIDAVVVVRCRDCKHRGDPILCRMIIFDSKTHQLSDWTRNNGFCDFGMRCDDA